MKIRYRESTGEVLAVHGNPDPDIKLTEVPDAALPDEQTLLRFDSATKALTVDTAKKAARQAVITARAAKLAKVKGELKKLGLTDADLDIFK